MLEGTPPPLLLALPGRSGRRAIRGIAGFDPVRTLLATTLFVVVVLERFGLNFGSYSFNACLVALYLLLFVSAATGRLAVSGTRAAVYAVAVAVAVASYAVNATFAHEDQSSVSSLLLLLVTYAPFPFVVMPASAIDRDPSTALARFVNVSLFVAIAGILQFYAQYLIHAPWLFDFTDWVPPVFRGPSGFHTVIRVGAHAKSNGFFEREPSGFSFTMALGLMAEWSGRRRPWVLVCHAFGLLLSYSGTGILALLIGSLFPIRRNTLLRVAVLGAAGAIVYWTLGNVLDLSFTLQRVFEFGSERSSGYIRYIAPFRLLVDTWNTEPWSLWLGHGPGTIARAQEGAFFSGLHTYEFHDPTWAKLLFEYGIAGFVAFVALFALVLRHPAVPVSIRAVLFFSWLIMGGHLLSPDHAVLTLALVGLFPRPGRLDSLGRLSFLPAPAGAGGDSVRLDEGAARG